LLVEGGKMKKLFKKIFKPSYPSEHYVTEEEPDEELGKLIDKTADIPPAVEEAKEEITKPATLQEKILEYFSTEFNMPDTGIKLKQASDPHAPPMCIIRSEEEALSVWYRMPIRGESGVTHIPDFTIFYGTQRMSPRSTAPDIVIECRTMPEETSNRTDTRVVKDLIGLSLDTMPGTSILVTNRPVSNYARHLAETYGIGLIEADVEKDSGYDLFKLIVSEDQLTRGKMLNFLKKNTPKFEHTFKLKRRKPIEEKQVEKYEPPEKKAANRKERILKTLAAHPGLTVRDLSSVTKINDHVLLNELFALERAKKVKARKKGQGANVYTEKEWSVVQRSSS